MAGETYGKIQTTFTLLTEETAIKWSFLFDSSQAIAGVYSWNAGEILQHNGAANGMVIISPISGAKPLGVAMDDHTTTLNETANSKITVIVNQHIGKTKMYSSTNISAASLPGIALYPSGTTAGYFDTIASAASTLSCARLVSCDGTWLTYIWNGSYCA